MTDRSNLCKLEELLRVYYCLCTTGKKKKEFMEKKDEILSIMDEGI